MAYPDEQYGMLLTLSDGEFTRTTSEPEPPVKQKAA